MIVFPTTPVLDSFTGADEIPITTNWTCPLYSGEGGVKRANNTLMSQLGSASATNGYYDLASFGPDCEFYVTLVTKSPTDGSHYNFTLRVSGAGGSPSGYELSYFVQAGTDRFAIRRRDAGVSTQLGADILCDLANGDGFGMQAIGNTLIAWHKPGSGAWRKLDQRDDNTYYQTGRLGVEISDSDASPTSVFDDFGGGNYVPETRFDYRRFPPVRRSAAGKFKVRI